MNEINDEEFHHRPLEEVKDECSFPEEGHIPLPSNWTNPVSSGGIKRGEVFVITAGGKSPTSSMLLNAYIEGALKGNALNSMWKSKDPNIALDPEVVYASISKDVTEMVRKDLSEKITILGRQTGKQRLTQSLIDDFIEGYDGVRPLIAGNLSLDECILLATDANRRMSGSFKVTVEKSRQTGHLKFALEQALRLSTFMQETDLKTIYSEPAKYVPKKSKRNKFDQLAQINEAQAKKRRNGKR